MHEYSIAYDIYATARRAGVEHGAEGIASITVEFGELSMVNPEQVEFLFGAISEEDPLFQGVSMECRTIPVRTRCPCGYEGSERFVCPSCGALPEIIAGREIRVSNIQIEVNDG
ncbi:MAG: hydrogenase maturation nickel metallochaperone HypA/HybF [Methanoculleaceae archaeon]